MIRAIIFDLDGVLVQTEKLKARAYALAVQQIRNLPEPDARAGEAYREAAAQESGAETTAEGMVFFSVEEGAGPAPAGTDTVKSHYHGTFPDGRVFDSSREGGEPATFALNAVVPCFSQGIQRMKVGGKAKLVCPPELAYGDRGAPPMVPPGATLIFEIELLEITAAAPAPPPPAPTP